jgi:hypothetical protein
MSLKVSFTACLFSLCSSTLLVAQNSEVKASRFAQLAQELPTPNRYRSASGAPGPDYWQQRADYVIDVQLHDKDQRITGKETIVYQNQSPDVLTYLWLQLDQNIFEPNSAATSTETGGLGESVNFGQLLRKARKEAFDGGFKIKSVTDKSGVALRHTVNGTMMRVDLPSPVRPGGSFVFSVTWEHKINDARTLGGRSGYEYFSDSDNYLYEMAQWFPRMAVYDDVNGWQHKQFLGTGEFALAFGDYRVNITVPVDHVVGATGVLVNAAQVLTKTQQSRLEKARTAKKPVLIITQEEALQNEKQKATATRTWSFEAKNVRDFAWVSSRKFIWDAMGVPLAGKTVMAMSYYPKEGNPLWEKYSTEAVAHTLKVYSAHTIDYPYPVAISVNGPVGGMEYPMICFNGPRPESDGTYSARTKYGLISVIIHEVGHNFFPMIINSDERQWSWMDEGLNTFMQFLAEQAWEADYPSRRGDPRDIVPYMKSDPKTLEPIMTNSESIKQFGNNAYGKPATALNILRETILGRQLFDFAFKEYSKRWAFKHPMPADFFRTIEDASGTDLDWFWRGWFYGIEPVDVAIEDVKTYIVDTQDPRVEQPKRKQEASDEQKSYSYKRNAELQLRRYVEEKPELLDFYNKYDPYKVYEEDVKSFERYVESLTEEERKLLGETAYYHVIKLKNIGGLVMPVILQLELADGSNEVVRIPAEIWRYNEEEVFKTLRTSKPLVKVVLDPFFETADIQLSNNSFPRGLETDRFKLYKDRRGRELNPMQKEKNAGGK